MIHRIVQALLFLLFLLFAGFQFNDEDPLLWVSLYGYAATMAALAFFGKSNHWLLLAGLVVYLGVALYYFPSDLEAWLYAEDQSRSLKMTMPFVEEARESMGALIAALALSYLLIRKRKQAS